MLSVLEFSLAKVIKPRIARTLITENCYNEDGNDLCCWNVFFMRTINSPGDNRSLRRRDVIIKVCLPICFMAGKSGPKSAEVNIQLFSIYMRV